MKICILMGDVPYPPRKNGVALRYYPLAKALSGCGNDVALRVLPHYELESNPALLDKMNQDGICASSAPTCHPRPVTLVDKLSARIAGYLPFGKPFSYIKYNDKKETCFFGETEDFSDYDVVICVTARIFSLYHSLPNLKKAPKAVCDFIDSPSLLFERSNKKSGKLNMPASYELLKIKHWEQSLTRKADRVYYISKVDSDFAQSDQSKTLVFPNGIEFSELEHAQPATLENDNLGFVGDMSYQPNVGAVVWFLSNIWVRYQEQNPNCFFYIVGRNPNREVLAAVKNKKNVIVTGAVENIWSYYKSIKILVCPLFSGAGLQNKVIEAMLAGCPVISTSLGNAGVRATHNESILLADDTEGFIEQTNLLRNDAKLFAKIQANAIQFAEENFDWEKIAATLTQDLKNNLH